MRPSRQPEPFPKGLQTLREACGLTQADLAQQLTAAGFPVSESQVANWECGQAQMPAPALNPLLEVIGSIVVARLNQEVDSTNLTVHKKEKTNE